MGLRHYNQYTKDIKWPISNSKFTAEIIKCKEEGNLSKLAISYFILLSIKVIQRLRYSDERDKEDCIQSALFDLTKYWKNFNPEKSNNAFAFFTQVAVNGYAKEFKKIHKNKINFLSLSFDGNSEIYTI